MKKIILSAAILALAGVGAAKAQTTTATAPVAATSNTVAAAQPVTAKADSSIKASVKLDELPDAVKTTLKGDAFKDWTPIAATHAKTSAAEYYEIALKKGDDTKAVKISADGQIVQ